MTIVATLALAGRVAPSLAGGADAITATVRRDPIGRTVATARAVL